MIAVQLGDRRTVACAPRVRLALEGGKMEFLNTLKGWIHKIIEVGLAVIALTIVIQVLFGQTPFVSNVVGNLTKIVGDLGGAGFVGLIALLIILYLFSERAKR
jgi:hypothetical protein